MQREEHRRAEALDLQRPRSPARTTLCQTPPGDEHEERQEARERHRREDAQADERLPPTAALPDERDREGRSSAG